MENHSYGDIIGSSSAPYINSLASKCGLATNFSAERHPSLPNYIAMTSGDTQGITDDNGPSSHPLNVPSIFSQLPGGGSRSLEESMPSNCPQDIQDESGEYAVRHNPMAYYTNLGSDCAMFDVPLGSSPDLSAKFTFVTPNLCNDMHDCSVSTGDSWLSNFIPQIVATPDYQAGKTAIFLTWDEDNGNSNNHIVTEVLSAHTAPGSQSSATLDHYNMLATTEDMLGVPRVGNAASASSMASDFGLKPSAISTPPQGNWVGSYGAAGYDLAAWNGGSDVVSMPGVSASLVQGNRFVWGSSGSDPRQLESLDKANRVAGTYWDWNEIRVQLKFSSAYKGNLELYALDYDALGRRETITVGNQTVSLSSDFSQGAWAVFPIDVAAGSSLTVKVDNTGWPNAVLSGIFLGGGGAPPPMIQTQPQGSWVGTYGPSGYDLAAWNGGSDLVSMPSAEVNLVQGDRYVWGSNNSDVRYLQSPDKSSRVAATYWDWNEIQVQLSFSSGFKGNLELYALDPDSLGRRETITVGNQTANLSSDFSQGAWVIFQIDVAAGSTLTIKVDNTGWPNAVLSGIFLN
jgi:hypothetical protein